VDYIGADVNGITVKDEINKLASNIAQGRDFAGFTGGRTPIGE
jgi:hypothetical protein